MGCRKGWPRENSKFDLLVKTGPTVYYACADPSGDSRADKSYRSDLIRFHPIPSNRPRIQYDLYHSTKSIGRAALFLHGPHCHIVCCRPRRSRASTGAGNRRFAECPDWTRPELQDHDQSAARHPPRRPQSSRGLDPSQGAGWPSQWLGLFSLRTPGALTSGKPHFLAPSTLGCDGVFFIQIRRCPPCREQTAVRPRRCC